MIYDQTISNDIHTIEVMLDDRGSSIEYNSYDSCVAGGLLVIHQEKGPTTYFNLNKIVGWEIAPIEVH